MARERQDLSAVLPSDNEFGIPSLRLDMQATAIVAPVISWGSLGRGAGNPGTWAFYVDDYRFSALLKDPMRIVNTGCAAAVEPNLTLFEQTPRYEVLAAIGRKRRVARQWQDAGVCILVDLNVPARYRTEALLGVPRGWCAYATRGYVARLADLFDEYELACDWAGGEPLLLVYGGGRAVETACQQLPGAVYVADFSQQRRVQAAGATP